VTRATRLAKVEASLSPTALIVRWLAEAHAYDDFVSYTRALLASDPPVLPLDSLANEAEATGQKAARGQPRDEAQAIVRRSIVGTVFRFFLVLRIIETSQAFLDREALIQAAINGQVALTLTEADGKLELTPKRLTTARDLLLLRVNELHATEAARTQVEARYLGGATALFPGQQRAWDAQRDFSERSAVIADRLAELDGLGPTIENEPPGFDGRVAELVADHIEPARSRAYDELGDGRRAQAIAIQWLRPKFTAEGIDVSDR